MNTIKKLIESLPPGCEVSFSKSEVFNGVRIRLRCGHHRKEHIIEEHFILHANNGAFDVRIGQVLSFLS